MNYSSWTQQCRLNQYSHSQVYFKLDCMEQLVQKSANSCKSLRSGSVLLFDLERFPVFVSCAHPIMFGFVGAAQVHMRKVITGVPRRAQGSLEPRNGFIGLSFLQKVGADIVVGV